MVMHAKVSVSKAAQPAALASSPQHGRRAAVVDDAPAPILVQRKCNACAKDDDPDGVLARQPDPSGAGVDAAPAVVSDVLRSRSGRALDTETRGFFEQRMGHRFGNVRIHTDERADRSARAVNAVAYTVGSDVVFRSGAFSPHTDAGKRLIAHELAHVVQQSVGIARFAEPTALRISPAADRSEHEADRVANAVVSSNHGIAGETADDGAGRQLVIRSLQQRPAIQRWEDCGTTASCPARDAGERQRSATARLQFGTLEGTTPIVYGFRIGSADVSTLDQAAGWATFWGSLVTQPNRWEIIGFSDCEGGVERNAELRLRRAMNVNNALPRLARARIVRFRGANLSECVAANDSAENRAYNRSVAFRLVESTVTFPDEFVQGMTCPPSSGAAVGSLSDYTALIACAERVTGYTPRQMLAMLRQMYYGKPWSATSQTDRWDNVIPCSIDLGNPRARLGRNLYDALWNSAEVAGVDVGHVFTGLEAMMCPSPTVTMAGGLAAVYTPNEDFATWAGDLGAAAASYVVCPQLGASAATNEDCFGRTGRQSLAFYASNQAPPQDMEGDIDAFVLRAASMGIPCTGSAQRRLALTRPISELFADYYSAPDSPLGRAHADSYRCFLQALGANVVGNRITNRSAIMPGLVGRVSSFAEAFYVKIWGGIISGGIIHQADFTDRLHMRMASNVLVDAFLSDLERNL